MRSEPPARDAFADLLPELHTWNDRPTEDDLRQLPGIPAVFLLEDAAGAPILPATTQNLRRLSLSRLGEASDEEGPTRKADLAAVTRRVRYRPVHHPFEGRFWYYHLVRRWKPREYRKLIGFGPAWFLNVDWSRPIPEINVMREAFVAAGETVGPWPTQRAAQQALEGLWDLFDLCRYPAEVQRAPQGKRCAYADMGRCDAPCDGSASVSAYADRVAAAWRFTRGGVARWIDRTTEAMHAAARAQAYERAALLKKQLEFAARWRRDWSEHVGLIDEWRELLVLPVTRRKAWLPVVFAAGDVLIGAPIAERKLVTEAPAWLDATLEAPRPPTPAEVRMEQTWLVAHLCHHKEGQRILRLPPAAAPGAPSLADRLTAALESRHADDEPSVEE